MSLIWSIKKALIWDETDPMGVNYSVTEIPDDLKENAKIALDELIQAVG